MPVCFGTEATYSASGTLDIITFFPSGRVDEVSATAYLGDNAHMVHIEPIHGRRKRHNIPIVQHGLRFLDTGLRNVAAALSSN